MVRGERGDSPINSPSNRSVSERPSFSPSILRMGFASGLKTNVRMDGLGTSFPENGSISSNSHLIFRTYRLGQSSVSFVKSEPVKAGRLSSERLEKPKRIFCPLSTVFSHSSDNALGLRTCGIPSLSKIFQNESQFNDTFIVNHSS